MTLAGLDSETGMDPILIYDGSCNLCSTIVDFLLRFDRQANIQMAASQSESGAKLIARFPGAPSVDQTVLLIHAGKVYARSNAIHNLLRFLPQPWPLLRHMLRVVPRPVRDGIYNLISRNRHRWFGRNVVCRTSAAGFESRFLP